MTWKIATFNVNGIRARLPIVQDWLRAHQPDVLCMQETKCLDETFPAETFRELGYEVNIRGQKSFNGVAILSKNPPEQVWGEFGDGGLEEDARLIAARVDGAIVVNTYVPMGRAVLDPAFQNKLDFFKRLQRWFENRFAPDRPLIWVGDLNVAREPIDVFNPERMEGEVGFHPLEREALSSVIDWGLTDLFRFKHPDERQFTFWDYRLPKSFERNLGWRLDLILATKPLMPALLDCAVDTAPRILPKPSDHTPVWAEFDLEKIG